MYQNPDTIKRVCLEMKNNIENYAKENCKIYESLDLSFIYTKQELSNKESWISKSLPSKRIINQSTSGSTNGEPFSYYNDKKYFDFIQRNSEFEIDRGSEAWAAFAGSLPGKMFRMFSVVERDDKVVVYFL